MFSGIGSRLAHLFIRSQPAIAQVTSDGWVIHGQWWTKKRFYIAVEIVAAVWYVIAGVIIYVGSQDKSFQYGTRVPFVSILMCIGLAQTVAGFVRDQAWRKRGGCVLVIIACAFGGFMGSTQ